MSCNLFRSLECSVKRALLFALIAGTLPCASAFANHVYLCRPAALNVPTVESSLFCMPISCINDATDPPTSEDYIIEELCE